MRKVIALAMLVGMLAFSGAALARIRDRKARTGTRLGRDRILELRDTDRD